MPKVYLMSGVPGSGKSTYIKKNKREKDVVISRDEIRFSLLQEGEDYFSKENEVKKTFFKEIRKALLIEDEDAIIYIDATHLSAAARRPILGQMSGKIQVSLLYFDVPIEIAIERNSKREGRAFVPESVIREMREKEELPTFENNEGLKEIVYIDMLGKQEYIKPLRPRVWVTSDSHIGHNKEFVYASRGFESPEEMGEAIVRRWNYNVRDEDIVYVLGDVVMGSVDEGVELLSRLNGNLYIIRGNHDDDKKIEKYMTAPNVVSANSWGELVKYRSTQFYMSHFPAVTMAPGEERKYPIWSLHGHTHQKTNFNENPHVYHVGMDSHNCSPVLLEDIYNEMKGEIEKWKN